MQKTDLDLLAEEVLTQLELKETHLLNWGIVGGQLDLRSEIGRTLQAPPSRLVRELWEKIQQFGETEESVLQNLIDRKLVFAQAGRGRTRYAETVKLLYTLKQRFSQKDWISAPNLVSQIKLLPTYRSYPKRNILWPEIHRELVSRRTSPVMVDALQTLLVQAKQNVVLSKFQQESLYRLLPSSQHKKDSATIIGAGTGSGKTKAFYLPAFAALADSVSRDPRAWTRILGVYPRTELLKDQYREALHEMEQLNHMLRQKGLRPVTIGAYYGDTPKDAVDVEQGEYRKWDTFGDCGYICPFANCPTCNGGLIWKKADVRAAQRSRNDFSHERLVCVECQTVLDSSTIMLTRNRMRQTPPDLLFTTTEMINRKLSDPKDHHVFGIPNKPDTAPLYLLLDEVHIYNGVTGAQAAYVLRRWRNMVRLKSPQQSLQVVGLSATLPNPQTFFSTLVGIPVAQTQYITPREEDVERKGVEYNAVLRGDPFSATALLSTSVQTAMLMGRMLDPMDTDVSHGAWGKKIFGFTDKLDIINRWYHIELDAERDLVLAKYRDPGAVEPSTIRQQIQAGQVWKFATDIDKRSLKNPLPLEITSSQHKGVDPNAKLVIATSTLEVGYNDKQVGAVIQHKAPRNLASFLQRKGRGGRNASMRPWTLVVTSAYGRDRYVFDYPEQLYSPMLPDLVLPLGNIYVQRIQAAYAIMDWFSLRLDTQIEMWSLLTPKRTNFERERAQLVHFLETSLKGNLRELHTYLTHALQATPETVNRLLWTPPRSIVMDLLPSLYAGLKERWSQVVEAGEMKKPTLLHDAPLFGYVPRNLFSALEVHELQLVTPSKQDHYLALRQGMMEFAPGNVSKRYVNINRKNEAHWFALPNDSTVIDLSGDMMNVVLQDEVEQVDGATLPVYLPLQYQLSQIPTDVTDRSTGFLQWKVKLEPRHMEGTEGKGRELVFHANSVLRDLIDHVTFHMSEQFEYVRVTRYAIQVKTETKYKSGLNARGLYSFQHQQNPAAVGFQVDADALQFRLKPVCLQQLYDRTEWEEYLQSLRPAYYQHLLREDEVLQASLSVFEIDWLWQICMASVSATAIGRGVDLVASREEFSRNPQAIAKRALEAIFQAQAMAGNEGEEETSKLYKRLLNSLQDQTLLMRFVDKQDVLLAELKDDLLFEQWVIRRLQASVGVAIQTSLESLLPDVNVEDLVMDIQDDTIWFTEPDSGGIGIISRIEASLRSSQGLFEELFMLAASRCVRHDLAANLQALLPHVPHFSANSFYELRRASTIDEQDRSLQRLQHELDQVGITPRRSLIVSLSTRVLAGNSNKKTDQLLVRLHEIWHEEERRLGLRIDPRVVTVACLRLPEIRDLVTDVFADVVQNQTLDEKQQFTLIESLLWSDCHDSCPECLQLYSPYQSFDAPDRQLLLTYLAPNAVKVAYRDPDFQTTVLQHLQAGTQVRVHCSYADLQSCRDDLLTLVMNPVELEYELVYPYVAGVENHGSDWIFDVRIREVQHA